MELTSESNGMRLRLTHEGLDHFPRLPRFQRAKFERGWTSLIGQELPGYLAGAPA